MFGWIVGFLQHSGYLGIAALMFAENIFPPIPSELIMPLAGFTAARGGLNIYLVVLSGTVGAVFGTLIWYYVGRWVGGARLKRLAARHGRWVTIAPEDVDRARAWFDRHGGKAVFIGRLIPAVRTLISVPAGITAMPLGRFLIYSAVGTALWSAFLTVCGYLLESRWRMVSDYVNPVSDVVIGIIVLAYLYRVVTWRRRQVE